ncbi:RagB/SusD family nutrient uptake outer membrane protein [Spongiimicrobium salis]|uniref:RagB/SusD family nutrient uptake outer membrane protein n=1 Tax=Spongiimicrobium salis TaxID=1667022 RepID=UPI00374D17EA
MKKYHFLSLFIAIALFMGCESDFLDTAPARSISTEQVAGTPAANDALINGIYANLRSFGIGNPTRVDVDYGHKGVTAGFDMMAQDIVLNNFNWYIFFYNYNGIQQTSSRTRIVWNTYYAAIADANSVITGLEDKEEELTAEENALLGQALAIKSFCLFNLVRVYAFTYIGHENDPGIPIPDRRNFEGKPRGTVQDVYDQIIPDLERAIGLLDGFVRANKQQIDRSVAQGILANVYLETGNWAQAELNAIAARANFGLMTGEQWATEGFDEISNLEWMWGADIDSESTTTFISFFSHFDSSLGGYGGELGGYKLIDARLYDQIPDTDLRKTAFADPLDNTTGFPDYANTKFDDGTEAFEGDYVYMRAAEMFLIEAEAKARQGNAAAADVLFDLVSTRDPGYVRSGATGDALVEEIYLQRRIELWGEGVSWFDLKRLKRPLDRTSAGTNHKDFGLIDFGIEANSFRMQIPEVELNSNENINVEDQNPS